jgi:hypothetical protein
LIFCHLYSLNADERRRLEAERQRLENAADLYDGLMEGLKRGQDKLAKRLKDAEDEANRKMREALERKRAGGRVDQNKIGIPKLWQTLSQGRNQLTLDEVVALHRDLHQCDMSIHAADAVFREEGMEVCNRDNFLKMMQCLHITCHRDQTYVYLLPANTCFIASVSFVSNVATIILLYVSTVKVNMGSMERSSNRCIRSSSIRISICI